MTRPRRARLSAVWTRAAAIAAAAVMAMPPAVTSAASLGENPLRKDYSYQAFTNITLPYDANMVKAVLQDRQGMIWIGTKRGLFSYNGYNLHRHVNWLLSDGNSISAIAQLSDSKLAVGTDYGLLIFDLLTERWDDPYKDHGQQHAVKSMAVFGDELWTGTRDHGLLRHPMDGGDPQPCGVDSKEEPTIFALEAAGDCLMVGSNAGLSHYDPATGRVTRVDLGERRNVNVYALLWDQPRRCVWVGAEGTLYRYDIATATARRMTAPSSNSFNTFTLDQNGNLLIGTDMGLLIYDISTGGITTVTHDAGNPLSLCNNSISCIASDSHGNVWLATDYGVSMHPNYTPFRYIRLSDITHERDGNLLLNMTLDSRGDYWLAGETGVIHVENSHEGCRVTWFRSGDSRHPLRYDRVRQVREDRDNNIWIATDGGIARYDNLTRQFVFYTIQDPGATKNANWTYDIHEDEQGRLWVAFYLGGLVAVDKKSLVAGGGRQPYQDILLRLDQNSGLSDIVYRIEPDNSGKLWLNTQNGLASVDTHTLQTRLYDIYMDNMTFSDGCVYYSSLGVPCRFDTHSLLTTEYPYTATYGQIHSLVIEGSRLWMTSADGIGYIDLETGQPHAALKSELRYQASLYDPRHNELLLGGNDCVVRLPVEKADEKPGRTVHVTSVLSGGSRLAPGDSLGGDCPRFSGQIKLTGRYAVTLELSSFDYTSQLEENFYYRFDGGNWQETGKGSNTVPIVNLQAGKHEIELSSSDPGLDTEATVSRYTIVVPYPWYSHPLALAAYAVVMAALLLWALRWARSRADKRLKMREREKTLELAQQKLDFFINVSHEIKTPLSLIIAPLSQLISRSTSDKSRKELTAIYRNAIRLNTLIGKVLDFKRLEYESDDTLIKSNVDLNVLLRSCLEALETMAARKGVDLALVPAATSVWAQADVVKLDSIFTNLITNAIKYSPESGGKVRVALRTDGKTATVLVEDNGQGFFQDDMPLLCVRFFQGRGRDGTGREGSGIGLYLARKYAEMHGGSLNLRNGASGGAIAEVTIPLPELPGDDTPAQEPEPAPATTVLIIDDNRELVNFLAEALSGQYNCLKAYDGREGAKLAIEAKPDLVIVDQMMPVMDGFECAASLRRNQATALIPIIMLTAKDDMQAEMKSIKMGIDVFVPKPFDMKKLQLRMAQLLQKRQTVERSVRMERLTTPGEPAKEPARSPDELLMERVSQAIEENLSREDFNVAALAQLLEIDNKQLYRKIKQLTGITPVSYLRKLRVSRAAYLLEQGKFTVSEVMYMVGYSNASHFSKLFARQTGLTPKQYADKSKAGPPPGE